MEERLEMEDKKDREMEDLRTQMGEQRLKTEDKKVTIPKPVVEPSSSKTVVS